MICACGVVVVHPDDERYQHLVGKKAILPMPVSGRETFVEIQTHPSVKSEFGSGILMVCSFGDQNDVAVFRELGLTPFQAIDLDGCMTDISADLTGLSVIEARAKATEMLEDAGNKFHKLKNVHKKYQFQNGEKSQLKLFFSKNGMFDKPTFKIE
jgi:valyl-tRNA synthetase